MPRFMLSAIEDCVRILLGDHRYEQIAGSRDFRRYPHYKNRFGGPLNGSSMRQDAVTALHRTSRFRAIVETGTYRGDTCEFFARFGLPVYTSEIEHRSFGYSRARFKSSRNVHLYRSDSRAFLR